MSSISICVVRSTAVFGIVACLHATQAGVIVGAGSLSLWGRTTPYTSWDVLFDPLPGLTDPAEGRVRDFAFHDGRLYCASNHALQNGGPWYYTPGASGSLAAPVQPTMPFPVGAPWRFTTNGSLAINTSGQGYGGFTGSNPALVGVGGSSAGGFSPQGYTLTPSGPGAGEYSVGSLHNFPSTQGVRPRSLEYISGIDRFVSVETNQGNPLQSVLNFHPHNASGILARDSFVTLEIPGIRGITPVSAAFASALTGQAVSVPCLLALQKDDIGLSDAPRLYVFTLSGEIVSQANYSIPGWVDPQAIAVDERHRLVFTSDRELGQIHVLRVPGPSGGAGFTALAILASARRRRHR